MPKSNTACYFEVVSISNNLSIAKCGFD